MDINEFKRILDQTVIPTNMPHQEMSERIEKLNKSAQSMMPSSLFRFRKCDERSIDAFYKDRVWVSTADCMNDGFDTRLFFSKSKILDWGSWFLDPSNQEQVLSSLNESKEPPEVLHLFPGMDQMFHVFAAFSDKEKRQMLTWFGQKVKEEVSAAADALADISQQTHKFCCLSTRIDSASMWGQYANNETGFALAYDCRDLHTSVPLENGHQRRCICFPIIYSDTRYQVSAEYIQFLIAYRLMHNALLSSGYANLFPDVTQGALNGFVCPDILVPIKIALSKSVEWEREEEWRVFCSCNDDLSFQNAKHACFTLKPKALYLGRRISSIYEKILVDIAKEKEMPVLKMYLDDDSPSFQLIEKTVSK